MREGSRQVSWAVGGSVLSVVWGVSSALLSATFNERNMRQVVRVCVG